MKSRAFKYRATAIAVLHTLVNYTVYNAAALANKL